jgi:fatty acid desaturase
MKVLAAAAILAGLLILSGLTGVLAVRWPIIGNGWLGTILILLPLLFLLEKVFERGHDED